MRTYAHKTSLFVTARLSGCKPNWAVLCQLLVNVLGPLSSATSTDSVD